MDNTNNVSQSIFQSSEPSFIQSAAAIESSSNTGFLYNLQNINITTWLLVILILAFLGFNIFVYLAKGTQDITNFFAPLLHKIFGVTIATTGQVVDISAEGAKAVVGETADVIESGLNAVQDITPNASKSSIQSQPINSERNQDSMQQTSLHKAINSSQEQEFIYQADSATSNIQGGGKSGWCYIGEDRGFRSCAEIGINDQCMSGEIFPTNEICMNPNLRN